MMERMGGIGDALRMANMSRKGRALDMHWSHRE